MRALLDGSSQMSADDVSPGSERGALETVTLGVTLHEAEGWRKLGYATESQYVRERLGISPSGFKAKVALARRWCTRVRGALATGGIGYEAARLILAGGNGGDGRRLGRAGRGPDGEAS